MRSTWRPKEPPEHHLLLQPSCTWPWEPAPKGGSSENRFFRGRQDQPARACVLSASVITRSLFTLVTLCHWAFLSRLSELLPKSFHCVLCNLGCIIRKIPPDSLRVRFRANTWYPPRILPSPRPSPVVDACFLSSASHSVGEGFSCLLPLFLDHCSAYLFSPTETYAILASPPATPLSLSEDLALGSPSLWLALFLAWLLAISISM